MVLTKKRMVDIIQEQPDDSAVDEILRELVLALMIERGLADSRAGRTISHDLMKEKIQSWQK